MDVRHCRANNAARPLDAVQVEKLRHSFMMDWPNVYVHPIIVTVADEDVMRVRDPQNYDWECTIEVGSFTCYALVRFIFDSIEFRSYIYS